MSYYRFQGSFLSRRCSSGGSENFGKGYDFNSARRALWLNFWEKGPTFKPRLCVVPFNGKDLFGSELHLVLTMSSQKMNKFQAKHNTTKEWDNKNKWAYNYSQFPISFLLQGSFITRIIEECYQLKLCLPQTASLLPTCQ